MKHAFLLAVVVLLFLGVQGCEKKTTEVVYDENLSPPVGLRSITGHGEIRLLWYTSNFERYFNGYEIWRMDSLYSGSPTPQEIPSGFEMRATIPKISPCNTLQSYAQGGLQNATTYSFLVVATNNKDEISQPSNIINDTPRPETSEIDYDTMHAYPHFRCGYELSYLPSDTSVVDLSAINRPEYSTDDGIGDFILELLNFEGGVGNRLWLAATNGGGIMDLGYMQDWNDADIAPQTGYAETGHSVYAIQGHVYAIKTGDNHYGKIQIMDLDVGWQGLSLKACYQTKEGEPQYKIRP
jgi:hypothetical protein